LVENLRSDAHAVLLPAFDGLSLSGEVVGFLRNGGKSILLGEGREEYVARRMSPERIAREHANDFRETVAEARKLGGNVLVAVDQELGGIQRLEGLGCVLPDLDTARASSTAAIEKASSAVARVAKSLGVNLFLAPVLDVVTVEHPWLRARTLGSDPHEVSRIGAAYIRGVQAAGVIACAKHFPGYPTLGGDPALEDVVYSGALSDASISSFRAAVGAGVHAIMAGPATVSALDADQPACTSAVTIEYLRRKLGFTGLVVSDDLDAPATLRGRSVPQTAVASLLAGAELLLVAASGQLEEIVEGIVKAVGDGILRAEIVHNAAEKVRRLADKFGDAT
jgi:beta-N-acetylhexosaminidase